MILNIRKEMATMIKFRAWDNENGFYLYNVQDYYGNLNATVLCDDGNDSVYDERCFGDFLNNKRYTVEQFTGLKDVDGNDIYEGDILHGYDQEPDIDGYIGDSVVDVVNFKYGAFWIGDSWYRIMVMTPPIVGIIGNVHENPELLEAGK